MRDVVELGSRKEAIIHFSYKGVAWTNCFGEMTMAKQCLVAGRLGEEGDKPVLHPVNI